MEMSELNSQWKRFVKEQRLYIIVEENEVALDFLLNLTFSNPTRKKKEGFESLKIEAYYEGDVEIIRKEKFDVSCCEYMDNGQNYTISWEINSNREEVYPASGIGFFFEEFFHFLKVGNNTVDKMLDLFELENKIDEAVAFLSTEEQSNNCV